MLPGCCRYVDKPGWEMRLGVTGEWLAGTASSWGAQVKKEEQ